MSINYNTLKAKRILGSPNTYSALEYEIVGKNVLALFIQGVVFFVFNLLLQYRFFVHIKTSGVPKSTEQSEHEDADVRNERQRLMHKMKTFAEKKSMMQMGALKNKFKKNTKQNVDDEDFVKLVNLTKVYSKFKKFKFRKFPAVKSLCLGINKGECFGLIGVNGAGI